MELAFKIALGIILAKGLFTLIVYLIAFKNWDKYINNKK
jgi:hypothetical protein